MEFKVAVGELRDIFGVQITIPEVGSRGHGPQVFGDEQLREAPQGGAEELSRSFAVDRFERELAEAKDGVEPHGPMGGASQTLTGICAA